MAKNRYQLAATAALVAVSMIGAGEAAFADAGTQPVPDLGSASLYTVALSPITGSAQSVSTTALAVSLASVSPSLCLGKTDNAHLSGTESSVHGRTTCKVPVTEVGVSTYLYNFTWWGWNNLNTDTSSRKLSTTSYDAHPHYPCTSVDLHDFYGASAHWSVEYGATFTGSTYSPTQTFRC